MRTLLQIIQAAANEMGLPTVASVVGNPDQQVSQMLALANREGLELAAIEGGWTAQRAEQTITWVAGTDNYAFPSAFAYYVEETMWDRSTRWPLGGPASASDWQVLKSGYYPEGVYQFFRIMNGRIYFSPTPASTDTVAVEYISSNWCQSSGGTGQTLFAADTDVPLLPDDLFVLGVKWRFKAEKGFDASNDFATYTKALARLHPRDAVPKTISMAERSPPFLLPGLPGSVTVDDGHLLI